MHSHNWYWLTEIACVFDCLLSIILVVSGLGAGCLGLTQDYTIIISDISKFLHVDVFSENSPDNINWPQSKDYINTKFFRLDWGAFIDVSLWVSSCFFVPVGVIFQLQRHAETLRAGSIGIFDIQQCHITSHIIYGI